MAKTDPLQDSYLRFSRPRNDCLLCSTPLNVDGKHPSLIEVSGKEEMIRKDFCPTCWERMREQGYFSFWITKRVNQPSAQERRLAKTERNEALWRLFAALYEQKSPELAPQLFLLAHLLMKYKVLTYAGPTTKAKLHFIHPKLGESFEVNDLSIDSVDFSTVLAEVEKQALEYAPEEDLEQNVAMQDEESKTDE